jgi:hypothetical protein
LAAFQCRTKAGRKYAPLEYNTVEGVYIKLASASRIPMLEAAIDLHQLNGAVRWQLVETIREK